MGRRVISGGLFAFLAACGGGIDTSAPTPAAAGPVADPPVQGVYVGPSAQSAETLTAEIGTPSAMVLTDDYVVVTTHDTLLQGERAAAGALFLVEKRPAPRS